MCLLKNVIVMDCMCVPVHLSKLHNEFLVRIEGFVSCGVWLQKKMVLWWNSVANKRRFTTTEETASPHTPNPAINIYIPSRSITALVHDNEERDLNTLNGGKIQSHSIIIIIGADCHPSSSTSSAR